ncbi:MAG: lysozyme inhibitor LprI family protein, partial [Terriglobus sp.]
MQTIAWVLLGLVSVAAHAASFDCAKAKRPVERAICSDPKLSAADSSMGAAYRSDLSRLSSNSVGLLRVDQVQWLAYVQQVCRVNETATTRAKAVECLQPLYDDRIKQLRSAVAVRDGLAFLTRTQFLATADSPGQNPDMPPGEHAGFGTMKAAWPAADTDDEQWIAWSAAVEAHMLKTAGAGQVQELNDGSKRTLPRTWDDQMAADTDTEITGVFRNVEHGRVTTVIATFGMGHGAAHPFDSSETLTWLLKEKRALRAEDVFDSVGWQHRLGEMLWADLSSRKKDESMLYDEVKGPDSKPLRDVLVDVTNWTLEKDGLHISYPNYTIAPRAAHPDD